MRRLALISWISSLIAITGMAQSELAPRIGVKKIASSLARPIFATAPINDSQRLFIVEQHTGKIRLLNLATSIFEEVPFLTVTNLTAGDEQGLLGLAFHPGYQTNGLFYVNYTTLGGGPAGHNEIASFHVLGDPQTSSVADPSSKSVLLTFDQPEANHNGGWIGFGPDGYLYIATGDGGGADDQHGIIGNAQNLGSLLGKILRIDIDREAPYAIPSSNPFGTQPNERKEIWCLGLRNPWRCSFDRQTGDLLIGDVGQSAREEIDVAPRGEAALNFGWRPREGLIRNPSYPNETPISPATEPVFDYNHSIGICVIGGYVYRGSSIPALQGTYFFADYGSGKIWSAQYHDGILTNLLDRTSELNGDSPRKIGQISSFGEGGAGELYICDLADGEIYRIVSGEPAEIQITSFEASNDRIQFRFNATPEQNYVVEYTESLYPQSWHRLIEVNATTDSHIVSVSDSVSATARYYRIRAL